MVTIHFIMLCFISLLCFSLGRAYGRIEAGLIFNQKINSIITALKRVQQLAELRGEDLTKVSSEEIVYRTQKQLELKDVED